MSKILPIEDRILRLSIARLAEAFGMSRATVSSRLAMHGVLPDGQRNGYPTFRLKDAAPALITKPGVDADGELDPRTLPAMQRNAWFASEQRRVDLAMTMRQLIPAAEHEADVADLIKELTQFLETLGDQLERDAGLDPEQVESINESIDRARQAFYDRLVADAGVSDSVEVK